MAIPDSDLGKQLAAHDHARWSHWMKYLFSVSTNNISGSVTIPADKVARWKRQMNTAYKELSEKEQKSNKEGSIEVLKIFRDYIYDELEEIGENEEG